ncbi:hypothetical protein SNEBB_005840 [Seison nebaliae]|nr:hypothetical protein SNEBB_005840 [Seison nebaliae]
MDLSNNYTYSLMHDRWAKINLLSKNNSNINGFYNSPELGLCLTNTLLSMITSSLNLMSIVKCRFGDCPPNIDYQVSDVYRLLCNRSPKYGIATVTASDVLIKGICDNYDGKKHGSLFGVAGDYYLLKNYSSKIMPLEFYEPSRIICHKLTRIIRGTKNNLSSDFKRWTDLIEDLLTPKYVSKFDFPFDFVWYSKIKMLNIELVFDGLSFNPLENRQFHRDYQNLFKHNETRKLNNILTAGNTKPKIIFFGFNKWKSVRLHPRFFYNFINSLNETYILYKQKNIPYHLKNFPVHFYPQTMSTPLDLNQYGNEYPFRFNNTNFMYTLKSISITLVNEKIIHLFDIPISTINNDEIDQCVKQIINRTITLLEERTLREIIHFMKLNIILIKYQFSKVCAFFLNADLGTDYSSDRVYIHAIALIFRNHKWIMMNDELSFAIENIRTITQMLKDESISSVLLEESNLVTNL